MQHQTADRIGRAGTVIQHLRHIAIAVGGNILAECRQQVQKRLEWQLEVADAAGQRDKNFAVRGIGQDRLVILQLFYSGFELRQQFQALGSA